MRDGRFAEVTFAGIGRRGAAPDRQTTHQGPVVKNVERRQTLRGPHFQHSLPEVTLEIARGAAQRRLRHVKPPVFLIGAAADCDLVLGDAQFPSVHTYLYVTKTGVSVRHIGEGPNLEVNGETVESTRIADGDRLRLGGYEFIVHVHGQRVTDEDRPRNRDVAAHAGSEASFDPDWEQLQLLLADLPAPLRPAAVSAQEPVVPSTQVFLHRRAVA